MTCRAQIGEYCALATGQWSAGDGRKAGALAMTLQEIEGLLTGLNLHFGTHQDEITFGFRTRNYKNLAGENSLLLRIRLLEEGRSLRIHAPLAMKARGAHPEALLKACMMAQWRTKLVQFAYDDTDGELRPIVELPIEDGTITAGQLERCVLGLVHLIDHLYPTLRRALDEGIVDFPEPRDSALDRQIEAIDTVIASIEGQPEPDPTLLKTLRDRRAALVSERDGPPTSV